MVAVDAGRDASVAVATRVDLVALALERPDERDADALIVLGDQDQGHGAIVGADAAPQPTFAKALPYPASRMTGLRAQSERARLRLGEARCG